MDIHIIGGGAIGLLFASYLSEDHHVQLYVRTEEQAGIICKEGIRLKRGGETTIHKVPAFRLDDGYRGNGLLIVAVKQYQLEEIMPVIRKHEGSILFLQNGMAHLSFAEKLAETQSIFVGVVEHGAMRTEKNEIVHTGIGRTKIAFLEGGAKELVPLPGTEAFPVVWEKDPIEMLQSKLLINSIINPLTAVLEVPNGELLDNPHYASIFDSYFEEMEKVLGVKDANAARENLAGVCRATGANRSSMLCDLEAGRQTEIDAILGYCLLLAKQKGVDAPISEILYKMVKGKEHRGKVN